MKNIKQLSIFAENKPGKLEHISKVFGDNKINILAFNIASQGDFGILRFIVDKPEKAFEAIKKAGFTISINDVFAIEMEDKPGGFFNVAQFIAKNNLNIENAYVYIEKDRKTAMLIADIKDTEKAKKTL
jgi:hypothetical protein